MRLLTSATTRTNAVKRIVALTADERDRAADARWLRAPNTGAERQAFDATKFLRVLLAELAEFHEQGEPLGALLLLGRTLEQTEVVHFRRL